MSANFFADTPDPGAPPPEDVYRYFAGFRIGKRAVDAFGVTAGPDGLVFRYPEGGGLFGADLLPAGATEIIMAADETSVLALRECGILHGVSLPARQKAAALSAQSGMLGTLRKVVLAGPPGVQREELARRLGRHRCWLVAWPDGCQSAAEALRDHGLDTMRRCIDEAQPYPIKGSRKLKKLTLIELRQRPAPLVMKTGTSLDTHVRFAGEGKLIVVTGIPNHGKSVFTTWLMIRLMQRYERRYLVFSPEMEPWEEYAAHCAGVLVGRPFRSGFQMDAMTDAEAIAATEWLMPRLTMLVADPDDEEEPTLDWLIERAEASVLRDGTTDIVIDPWGDLDHSEGDKSETKYIGQSLQRLRRLAKRHGCNVWIIAHPRIQRPAKVGEPLSAPGLYEISGSAAWSNRADIGLAIHTPGELTEVHVCKTRFSRWGRKGARALMAFDEATGRYSDASAPVSVDAPVMGGRWNDP